mmetsp:Transcript_56741/g.132652  ORF Transcript_56741/g.132652 Transcript_56741/m.132652 type:complete len:400 (+) Transcript_56741:64-1263(+)
MPQKLIVGIAAVAALHATRRSGQRSHPCHCEVRLWGPHGTYGRAGAGAGVRAAEKAAPPPRTKLDEVEDFIREGPLYRKLLLQSTSPPFTAQWLKDAEVLAGLLEAPSSLPSEDPKVARRIYHFYLPLYYWMRHQIEEIRVARDVRGEAPRAICFGLSAPQGCGKTTAVALLEELFRADGLSCQSVSIDDFYLPANRQEAISEAYADNPLMQTRGNAGTHDVQLGTATLRALKSSEEGQVPIPRYDKSARSGKGDRFPKAMWESAKTPCDVLLLEGWMLGFKPSDPEEVTKVHPGLRLVNDNLKSYQEWDSLVDSFCILAVEDVHQVYTWRQQAEEKMKETTGSGMDAEGLRRFISNYMPAYEAYRHRLYASAMDVGVDGKPSLLCWVGPDRMPYEPEI